MDILLSYIIKSFVASGILYGYYLAALKNKKFHAYNRFYLLLSVICSLVVPFINFEWIYIDQTQNAPLADVVNIINSPGAGQPVSLFTPAWVLSGISLLISCLLLFFLVSKIAWIYRVKKAGTEVKLPGYTLVETGVEQAPFSFLSNLFWKRGLSATDTNGEKIFKHELTHIRQKHTYDKLFTQIVCCLGWINPFYWLIQRELNTIHEFIADAASIKEGDTESFAQMLLHVHNEGRYLSPAHSFFNSSIKRRLVMISLSNNTRYSYIRRILVLPVALFVVAVLSVSVKAQADKKAGFEAVKEAQLPVTDTIPKPGEQVKKTPAPITVTGKKLKTQPALTAITVTGKKLNKLPATKPITVTGKKLEPKPALTEVTVIGKKLEPQPALKPITVTGKKLEPKPALTEVTVIGKKSDKLPALEPVTVPGKKLEPPLALTEVTVIGKKSENHPSPKPVIVPGKKLVTQPVPVTAPVQKVEKKP